VEGVRYLEAEDGYSFPRIVRLEEALHVFGVEVLVGLLLITLMGDFWFLD
jgi:hypothetical protein